MQSSLQSLVDLLNSPAFHIASAPASWGELIGALLGIAMVVGNIRQIHWAWPLAFLSSVLYGYVFWGVKLYAEASLQIFFAVTAVWGWVQWLRGTALAGEKVIVHRLNDAGLLISIVSSAVLISAIGLLLSHFTDSPVPWWDAIPTALSLVATVWLGRKLIENWPLWIVINVISMGLFAYKGLWLTVGLYAVFTVMAAVGWRAWAREARLG
jgi:nicotinamide mononucleotide transporter